MTGDTNEPPPTPEPVSDDDARLLAIIARKSVPCPWCGYDMHGLDHLMCPECGQRVRLMDVLRPISRMAPYIEAFAHVGILLIFLGGLAIGAVIIVDSRGHGGGLLAGVVWLMFMLLLMALVIPSLKRTRGVVDRMESRHWITAVGIWGGLIVLCSLFLTTYFFRVI